MHDTQASPGHTNGMKVAVSIPDEIFVEAEALAKRVSDRVSKGTGNEAWPDVADVFGENSFTHLIGSTAQR